MGSVSVPERYLRQGVLDHRHLDARAADPNTVGVVLCERRFVGKINLRGRPNKRFLAAVRAASGLEPPTEPNTAVGGNGRTALWLGPDEWLIVTAPGEEGATCASLRAMRLGQHFAVTDVGEGRGVIGLAGPRARDVLAKGCPLDLHPRAFGPGRCAQSTLAKALVILHQTSDRPDYDIYVDRSFADYLWTWLEDAAAEYGVAITMG